MIKIQFIMAFLIVSSQTIIAKKNNYPVSDIPEFLKTNADAVVRFHEINKVITSDSRVKTEETFVVTIFNKSAQSLGYFYEGYDKISSLTGYSVKLYSSIGELINSAQTKDFKDVKAYDGFSLFDDNRLIYYQTFYNYFPYTVEIKFSKTDKQTLNIGSWNPVGKFNVAVQFACFKLTTDQTNNVRYQEKNLISPVNKTLNNSTIQYYWELKDFQAIDEEPFMPDYQQILPKVTIAANKFNYDGYTGIMADWESFGKWNWELIKGRDVLELNTVTTIKSYTDSIPSYKEKIKFLYKYLQDNTHYVSIQLGIGGWQPFEAALVDKTKYGDCKALSNYMKALLNAANINSEYAVIRAGKNEFPIDDTFPSNQFNHVILCVPNSGDTIWLECTSQKQPFGFLGSFTENRSAFLIKDKESHIVKTPEYTWDMNTQFSKTKFVIDSTGNCNLESNTCFSALQYENIVSYFYMSPKEQKEALYKQINIPNSNILKFSFSKNNEPIPVASRQMELAITKYCTLNGNRMFLPINLLNPMNYVPEKIKNRKYPIIKHSCGYDADTMIYELPQNYSVEYLPEPVGIKTPYGEYNCKIELNGNTATYFRSYKWNKGEFQASEYDNVRAFYKAISSADENKIVLIKKL